MTKAEWLEKNNFNKNGETWIICGGDTYAIKDELKELGFKFSPILKWHINAIIEIPEEYHLFKVSFETVYEWNDTYNNAYPLAAAKEKIEAAMRAFDKPSLSNFIGIIGERLRNVPAIYISQRGFNTQYGYTLLHTFQIGEDVLVWFTQKELNFEKGQSILLSGTIKKHDDFRGTKTTQLSRCIVKEA